MNGEELVIARLASALGALEDETTSLITYRANAVRNPRPDSEASR